MFWLQLFEKQFADLKYLRLHKKPSLAIYNTASLTISAGHFPSTPRARNLRNPVVAAEILNDAEERIFAMSQLTRRLHDGTAFT